jgi:hypothetical protein
MADDNGGDGATAALHNESGVSIVNTLSIIIVLAFIGMVPLWMWFPPMASEGVLAIINMLVGALATAFATVIAYHFGSSRSTKELGAANRDALTTMANTAQTTATTAATTAATVAARATAPTPPTPTPPATDGASPGSPGAPGADQPPVPPIEEQAPPVAPGQQPR